MNNQGLTEKELRIIEELAKNKGVTQRELSRKAGVSVGMVNISLRRLAKKGYVKIKEMNKRSLEYSLTPSGFAEKARKSYHYFLNTLNLLKELKVTIQALILKEYVKGIRNFVILGDGELADIVEISFRRLSLIDITYERVKDKKAITDKNCAVFATSEKYETVREVQTYINIVDTIQK